MSLFSLMQIVGILVRRLIYMLYFNLFQSILNTVLDKHRAGIVVKQVAAGREFSGCPFYSKPDIIHFKVSES